MNQTFFYLCRTHWIDAAQRYLIIQVNQFGLTDRTKRWNLIWLTVNRTLI